MKMILLRSNVNKSHKKIFLTDHPFIQDAPAAASTMADSVTLTDGSLHS